MTLVSIDRLRDDADVSTLESTVYQALSALPEVYLRVWPTLSGADRVAIRDEMLSFLYEQSHKLRASGVLHALMLISKLMFVFFFFFFFPSHAGTNDRFEG